MRSLSIRLTRRIAAQPALAPYHPDEYLPGAAVGDDDDALAKAAGDIGTTIFIRSAPPKWACRAIR